MSNQITLVQHPIISHKLQEAGKLVSKRIQELDIEKQVATVETVKSLKDLRADLNKELAEFESQRKAIKEGVNTPYNEFESIYKVEISEKYKSAIDLLKDKIDQVETKVKTEKKEAVEAYFKELCVAENIDFINFDKLNIEINLSTSEKKYKEQVNEFITKVVDDLNLIKSTEFEAEILTEYKSTLNASKAITDVKTRKEQEQIEAQKIQAQQRLSRIKQLEVLGMKYEEITNAYEFNADIYITMSDINILSKEDFSKKYADLEVKIKDLKSKQTPTNAPEIDVDASVQKPQAGNTAAVPVAAPVSAPKVEAPQEAETLKKASFEVTATMNQLRALGAYMRENNITYKNI